MALMVMMLYAFGLGTSQTLYPRTDGGDDTPNVRASILTCYRTGGGQVTLKAPIFNGSWHFNTELLFSAPEPSSLSGLLGQAPYISGVDLVGEGPFAAIRLGHSGAGVHAFGAKQCGFYRLRFFGAPSNNVGIWVDGDDRHPSTSELHIIDCRYQPDQAATNNTGIRLGNGFRDDDVSGVDIDRFSFYAADGMTPSDVPGAIRKAHAMGHRGIEVVGSNTLDNNVDRSRVSGADVALCTVPRPGMGDHHNANGLCFEKCSGSYNATVLKANSYESGTVRGGRWEQCGGMGVLGVPFMAGVGRGSWTFEGIVTDAFDTTFASTLGNVDSGSWLSVNGFCTVRIIQCIGIDNKYTASRVVGIRALNNSGVTNPQPVKLTVSGSFFSATQVVPYEGGVQVMAQ